MASAALVAGCGSAAPASGSPSTTAAARGTAAASGTEAPAASGTGPPAPAPSAHNATDVMFLQMMVAREKETAELIDRGRARSLPGDLATLTEAIRATQADETRLMTGWLKDWKQPIAMDPDAAAHTHHGGRDLLTRADLNELAGSGDFTTRFLNLLIGQQHNAVELARMEAGTGVNPGARDLARRIDQSRTAQIATLLALVAPSTG
jgi:uncharacterized protein (DUF305 family)